MREIIQLDHPPAGYARKLIRKGETGKVVTSEFISTEDGQDFVEVLEGFPNSILQKLSVRIAPSQVDHMLVVIKKDGQAAVIINELEIKLLVRAARAIAAGSAVTKDDMADIHGLDLGVKIDDDVGFLFLFSVGWRKGLFFDFRPSMTPDAPPRTFDVGRALGSAYCQLIFQERYRITNLEWDALTDAKWFPFAGLSDKSISLLIQYVRAGHNPDELIDDIAKDVTAKTPEMIKAWQGHSAFTGHRQIIEQAVLHFGNGDYLSCVGLLYPRIEGILRSNHYAIGSTKSPGQTALVDSAGSEAMQRTESLLMPQRFDRYLRQVYFKNFQPGTGGADVSRHSVSHGEAAEAEFNLKSAVIGILVAHQLVYYLPNQRQDAGAVMIPQPNHAAPN